jgi:Protein of unknown function (DUF3775).
MPMISVNKINDIIQLAYQRHTSYNSGANSAYESYEVALENYLNNLTFDEVMSLQAIMYLGRDKDYNKNQTSQQIYKSQYDYFDKVIGWSKKEIEINQIAEKLPLDEYLINAKKILGL